MSIYLHDIPLPEAKARLEAALKEAGLWRVLGLKPSRSMKMPSGAC